MNWCQRQIGVVLHRVAHCCALRYKRLLPSVYQVLRVCVFSAPPHRPRMTATFHDVADMIQRGSATASLSRIGKNESSRSLSGRANANAAKMEHVQARTSSRRNPAMQGLSRSSYLQSVEDSAGATRGPDDAGTPRGDDGGPRREMCSSPRLHPGLQLERLRDYQAERTQRLTHVVTSDAEFAKIRLKDDGTCIAGTEPAELAWTPRATKVLSEAEAAERAAQEAEQQRLAAQCGSERAARVHHDHDAHRVTHARMPPVGHYRPRYDLVECSTACGGYIQPKVPVTPRGAGAEPQRASARRALPESGKNSPTQPSVVSSHTVRIRRAVTCSTPPR